MMDEMEEELNDLEMDWLIDDYAFYLQVQKRNRGKQRRGARVAWIGLMVRTHYEMVW
jgi:hypothetical protein